MNGSLDVSPIKVSAIISTCNRYPALLKAIASVQGQTHKNIELFVVNDGSSDSRYYANTHPGIHWIDLPVPTRQLLGFPCPGYVRNQALAKALGEYIAFLDDDDVWMPDKIQKQLVTMVEGGWQLCCSEGYIGPTTYEEGRRYPIYHAEYYAKICRRFFCKYAGGWSGKLPDIFDLQLIRKHNFFILSSSMIKRELLERTGLFAEVPPGGEDWDLWKRALAHVNCRHLNEPLVYYDGQFSSRARLSWAGKALRRIKRFLNKFQMPQTLPTRAFSKPNLGV